MSAGDNVDFRKISQRIEEPDIAFTGHLKNAVDLVCCKD